MTPHLAPVRNGWQATLPLLGLAAWGRTEREARQARRRLLRVFRRCLVRARNAQRPRRHPAPQRGQRAQED